MNSDAKNDYDKAKAAIWRDYGEATAAAERAYAEARSTAERAFNKAMAALRALDKALAELDKQEGRYGTIARVRQCGRCRSNARVHRSCDGELSNE